MSAATAAVETEETAAGPRRLAILLLAVIGASQTMDPPIANTALVEATKAIGIPAGAQSLAASVSTLAAAATVITMGFIADRIGRRKLLIIALVLSIVGDAVAASAWDTNVYLLGRALAGVGLGAAFSSAFAYVRIVAGEGNLGAALGSWTAQLTLFSILGSVFGGFVTNQASWRVALLIVPFLCLVSLALVPRMLPVVEPTDTSKPDWLGQALLMVGVVGTLYGMANMANSFTSVRTLGPLVGGIVCLGLFAVVELRLENAVFPIRLFGNKLFIAAVCTGLLWNFVDATSVLQFSNLWQYVMQRGTELVSLGQLPLAGSTVVGAAVVGILIAKGVRFSKLFLIGVVLIPIGISLLVFLQVDSPWYYFLPVLIPIGLGLAFFNIPSANLFVSEAPAESYGVVTSSRLMVGQFGYSMATALSTVLVNGMTQGGVTKKLEAAGVPPEDIGAAWSGVNNMVRFGAEPPSTDAGRQALAAAGPSYVHAFTVTMLVVAALVVVVGLLAAWLVKDAPDESGPADEEAPAGEPTGALDPAT